MRVRILFELVNGEGLLPFHHQNLLSQLIKATLRGQTTEFSQNLNYNFSGIKGQTKVTPDGLFFHSPKVTLVLSAADPGFVEQVVRSLLSMDKVFVGSMVLRVVEVSTEIYPKLERAQKYVCLSPFIPLCEGEDLAEIKRFTPPDTLPFAKMIQRSVLNRMEKSGRFDPSLLERFQNFRFEADRLYLLKARATEKKFSRIYSTQTSGNQIEVRGYTFPFLLEAEPEVHEFLLTSGFGELTSEGFGMLDLADHKNVCQFEPFHLQKEKMLF